MYFLSGAPKFPLILSHCYAGLSQARDVPSTSYAPARQKRSYEEDDDMDTQPQKQREPHAGTSCCLREPGAECVLIDTSLTFE